MLTKKQQTSSNRLKPTVVKNKKFLSWCHSQGLSCFACSGFNKIELHHIKSFSSDHKDDTKVIPLCGETCHRTGTELSAHGTPKKFRDVFPVESQLEYAKDLYSRYKDERIYK